MANINSQELYLVCLVTLFALIGLFYVLRGAIRWLRAWEGPKGALGFLLLMYGIIALVVVAFAVGTPPFIYYFGNYVGRPVGMFLKQWWTYWGI